MHALVRLGLLVFGAALPAAAQSPCPALTESARGTELVRRQLRATSVREDDPKVPTAVASQLVRLKDTLGRAADAAFRCAPAAVLPETLQTTLASALHANLPLTGAGNDTAVYGSDLRVQVFQLFGKPKLFYVDFRYGIACGDDHLLLVYETASDAATDGWHPWLRWDAHSYNSVANAFGDFVLLTPLTGNDQKPQWHFLVAHGQPGCADTPRPSRFDLDLLTPGPDPARPTVTWHFEHPYTAGDSVPRLATTESTIDFRLAAPAPESNAKPTQPTAAKAEDFRFRLTAAGKVEPMPVTSDDEAPAGAAQTPAEPSSTHSPQ